MSISKEVSIVSFFLKKIAIVIMLSRLKSWRLEGASWARLCIKKKLKPNWSGIIFFMV